MGPPWHIKEVTSENVRVVKNTHTHTPCLLCNGIYVNKYSHILQHVFQPDDLQVQQPEENRAEGSLEDRGVENTHRHTLKKIYEKVAFSIHETGKI